MKYINAIELVQRRAIKKHPSMDNLKRIAKRDATSIFTDMEMEQNFKGHIF